MCRETSIVDYFITTLSLFGYVNSLNVQNYCPLLSDVHKAVSLEFSFNTTLVLENDTNEPEICFWRDDKKDQRPSFFVLSTVNGNR